MSIRRDCRFMTAATPSTVQFSGNLCRNQNLKGNGHELIIGTAAAEDGGTNHFLKKIYNFFSGFLVF